jgi:biotin synthase
LSNRSKVNKELVLQTIAVTRFVDSDANILVATALETLDPKAKEEALLAGANSLMINVTPEKYRQWYAIYDNKIDVKKEIGQNIQDTVELLYKLGRAPADIGMPS